MAQVSLRIQKLKPSNLAGVKKHNQREHNPANADPTKTSRNQVLVGGDDLLGDVYSRIQDTGVTVVESGKNTSTVAVEMVISASPEYFRENPHAHGKYKQAKLDAWRAATLTWLSAKYADNLVRVDLHLDEKTPHMHAIITPIVEKQRKVRGKDEYKSVTVLDAKNMFNRQALVDLQTEAAEAVSHLGIKRGTAGSKATHQSIKQFYGSLNSSMASSPQAERITDEDFGFMSGMSKRELANYANEGFEFLENRLKSHRAQIVELENTIFKLEGSLGFYRSLGEIRNEDDLKSALKTVVDHNVDKLISPLRDDLQQKIQRAEREYTNAHDTIRRKYDALVTELYTEISELQEAFRGEPIKDPYGHPLTPRDWGSIKAIDKKSEIERSIKPNFDDDSPSM